MKTKSKDIQNLYRLDGRIPLLKAVPFGLQHILAMFVANLTPITIIADGADEEEAVSALSALIVSDFAE